MLKIMAHNDSICGTGNNTKIAEGTHAKMVNEFINGFFLFAFGCNVKFSNDLDRSIRSCKLAGGAARTTMFIVLIVRHYYFSFKSLRQIQCCLVIRILLCNDLFVMRKIIHRTLHAFQQ